MIKKNCCNFYYAKGWWWCKYKDLPLRHNDCNECENYSTLPKEAKMKSYLLLWTKSDANFVTLGVNMHGGKLTLSGLITMLNDKKFTPEDIDRHKCRIITDGDILNSSDIMKLLKYDYPEIEKKWMEK